MQTYLDCIPCFLRQTFDAAKLATDNEQIHEQVVRQVLRLAADLDMSQSPPVLGQQIHRLIRELLGTEDPYRKMKKRLNELVLRLHPYLCKLIAKSKDPLETAIRLAIGGNIIDFGVLGPFEELSLETAISESLAADFDSAQLEPFRDAVTKAQEILYLCDNAGEIAFDRLLIKQLPHERVTVAVKGRPVINDATIEDAQALGLTDMVEVIDNGDDAPATILESCSEHFRIRFYEADLIIAKGQGNYETLSAVKRNIFFMLKAKCPVIARDLGCEVGKMILGRSQTCQDAVDLVKEAK